MSLAGRFRCRQIPAFCDDVDWPVLEWEMLFDQDGNALSGEAQEESWFYTPTDREGDTPSACIKKMSSKQVYVTREVSGGVVENNNSCHNFCPFFISSTADGPRTSCMK